MKHAAKALIRDGQGKILVLYRSETHPHLAHDIDLPGGEIEIDETLEIGLMREIEEETGLTMTVTQANSVCSWQSELGQEQCLYEVIRSEREEVTISWEHEAHDWVSPEEMVNYPAIDGFMHHVQAWLRE